MKRALPYLAVIALAVPGTSAAAQSGGWWGTVSDRLPTRSGRQPQVCRIRPDLPACDVSRSRDRDRGDIVFGRREGRGQRRGNGPPFCRNGRGHPTKGLEWCREKGWGTGGWYDVGWEDVILGRPRTRQRTLGRGGLIDVLGDIVLGRLQRRAGAGTALSGRLLGTDRRILQVRAGGVPLAELLDVNADGRADRILLYRQ